MVLDCFLDGKSWPLVDLQVEVTGVGAEVFGVNDSEIDLPFVFPSDWFEGFGQFGALLGRFRENVGQRDTSLRRALEL